MKMTRFEEKCIEKQYNSFSKKEAVKNFEKSCTKCCLRNLQIPCHRCSVNAAHRGMVEYFDVIAKRDTKAKCVF